MILFDQRESKIDAGGDSGRAVEAAVADEDRIDFRHRVRTAPRQFGAEVPVRRHAFPDEQAGRAKGDAPVQMEPKRRANGAL